jgi:hypothetical protein
LELSLQAGYLPRDTYPCDARHRRRETALVLLKQLKESKLCLIHGKRLFERDLPIEEPILMLQPIPEDNQAVSADAQLLLGNADPATAA